MHTMSYLAVKVRNYVTQPGVTALGLEKSADVPATTISNILRDSHPRPDRFGRLLRVLPSQVAVEWLTAYLLDDVPDAWRERVQIIINGVHDEPSTLCEPTPDCGPPDTALAISRLTAAMDKDDELGRWFVQTVKLLLD
jgi:hypothetical protein